VPKWSEGICPKREVWESIAERPRSLHRGEASQPRKRQCVRSHRHNPKRAEERQDGRKRDVKNSHAQDSQRQLCGRCLVASNTKLSRDRNRNVRHRKQGIARRPSSITAREITTRVVATEVKVEAIATGTTKTTTGSSSAFRAVAPSA